MNLITTHLMKYNKMWGHLALSIARHLIKKKQNLTKVM